MFSDTSSTSKSTVATPQPTIHIVDCVCNTEAMVCAVLAEYSLPFFLAETIIGICKKLSNDSAALKRLHMFRTSVKFVLLSFPSINILFQYKLLNFCWFKACVRYFLSNFYFSPNDSPLKTTKNVFYFI